MFPGLAQGWALPLPRSVELFFLCQVCPLGETPLPVPLAFSCSSQSGGVTDGFRFWQLVKAKSVSGSDDITFCNVRAFDRVDSVLHIRPRASGVRIRWSQNVSVCCSSGGALSGNSSNAGGPLERPATDSLLCVAPAPCHVGV